MLGEQLLMSLKVIVLGMGTVFIALVALIYVIELVNKVLDINNKATKEQNNRAIEDLDLVKEEVEDTAASNEGDVLSDEEELVAVITAAIAASLNRSTHDILVKSIRKIPSHTPAWNRAGRSQQIANRF